MSKSPYQKTPSQGDDGGASLAPKPGGIVQRMLDWVERVGNKLPQPVTLFVILIGVILVASAIFSALGTSAVHPGDESTIEVVNLLDGPGIQRIFTQMVSVFTSFAPLGLVLAVMLGIGVAERSGMIAAALKGFVSIVPQRLMTFALVTAGMLSSLAADAGYVVLIPLGAVIFHSMGRHPIAGLAATFAGVSGGFGANLFLTGLDPMLAGITTEAAEIYSGKGNYYVAPTANWYLMAASVPLIALAGTFITEKILEPRLGRYEGDGPTEEESQGLTALEKKGLKAAGLVLLGLVVLIAWGSIPERGIFRRIKPAADPKTEQAAGVQEEAGEAASVPDGPKLLVEVVSRTREPVHGARIVLHDIEPLAATTGPEGVAVVRRVLQEPFRIEVQHRDYKSRELSWKDIQKQLEERPGDEARLRLEVTPYTLIDDLNPLFNSIVPLMLFLFFLPGLAYGIVTGSIRSDKQVAAMTAKSMSDMGGYIVLAFVAAQFVAFFNWSNLGVIFAITGADLLKGIGFTGIPLIVLFILVSSFINIIIGSASAKWAILAPIFVPMLMLMGYSPELTQAAYRVGDSYSNIITPLLPYFPLIIVFAQRYKKDIGIGTIVSLMLPFAVVFAIVRIPMLVAWMLLEFPLGPGAPLTFTP